MKKLALSYSSKDRVHLTEKTLPRAIGNVADLFWNDGSSTDEGKRVHQTGVFDTFYPRDYTELRSRVTGGPDRAIAFALSQMLADKSYTHIGLLENDVLLDPDWLEPTLALFDNPDGLPVGAVSARAYEDRVLIQRDGYAIMHNVGAGHIIFTREAAQIILQNYRTGWWSENRSVFSQLSGIDIGKFAAFGFNEQMITADWSWDTILAAHGLATVALTPSKATMIGQDIAEQGLQLVDKSIIQVLDRIDYQAFDRFRANLIDIREGRLILPSVDHLLRTQNGYMIFPHHAESHAGIFTGKWTSKWSQGCGPFTYVAGPHAQFSIPLFGPCSFHVSSGHVAIKDDATGFSNEIDMTGTDQPVSMSVPRDMQYGRILLTFGPGACLNGIETVRPQARVTDSLFDYNVLPETA